MKGYFVAAAVSAFTACLVSCWYYAVRMRRRRALSAFLRLVSTHLENRTLHEMILPPRPLYPQRHFPVCYLLYCEGCRKKTYQKVALAYPGDIKVFACLVCGNMRDYGLAVGEAQ